MKPTRANLMRVAARLGADVTIREIEANFGPGLDIDVAAPAGHVWSATGTHGLVAATNDDERAADLYETLLDDMECGIESCSDPDCDQCGGH